MSGFEQETGRGWAYGQCGGGRGRAGRRGGRGAGGEGRRGRGGRGAGGEGRGGSDGGWGGRNMRPWSQGGGRGRDSMKEKNNGPKQTYKVFNSTSIHDETFPAALREAVENNAILVRIEPRKEDGSLREYSLVAYSGDWPKFQNKESAGKSYFYIVKGSPLLEAIHADPTQTVQYEHICAYLRSCGIDQGLIDTMSTNMREKIFGFVSLTDTSLRQYLPLSSEHRDMKLLTDDVTFPEYDMYIVKKYGISLRGLIRRNQSDDETLTRFRSVIQYLRSNHYAYVLINQKNDLDLLGGRLLLSESQQLPEGMHIGFIREAFEELGLDQSQATLRHVTPHRRYEIKVRDNVVLALDFVFLDDHYCYNVVVSQLVQQDGVEAVTQTLSAAVIS